MTKNYSNTSDASVQLGSYTSYVNSKKGGACTPVRRSRRLTKEITFSENASLLSNVQNNRNDDSIFNTIAGRTSTPHPKKSKSRMEDESKVAVADVGISGKENGSGLKQAASVDDLCTLFQTTCSVDNVSLEVQSTETKILSPLPKEGRYVTAMKEGSEGGLTPVKRSTRFMDHYATSMKEIDEGVLVPVKRSTRF